MPGVSLGSWAAKVFNDQGRDLVLALDTRTYLTLLFPLGPAAQFRSDFANALANALEDAGVPPAIKRMECVAIEFEPLACLRNPELTGTLNDVPHPNRDPCVPIEAIKHLFLRAAPGRACRTSCLN
jgi:hypothetical protein